MRALARRGLTVAVMLLSTSATLAGSTYPPLTGYALGTWAERDGIPLGPVYALTQDQQGYLWLGTESGLLRFDGVRFLTADAAGLTGLPAEEVHALLAAADGTLWVGTADGGGVHAVAPAAGSGATRVLPGVAVNDLVQTRDGAVWAATTDGIYRIADGAASRAPMDAATATNVRRLFLDAEGRLWAGTMRGLYRQEADGAFRRAPNLAHAVRGIAEDSAGVLWTTHPTLGFSRADARTPVEHMFEGVGLDVRVDSRRNLWVATRGQGLWRVFPDAVGGRLNTERASVDSGLLSDGIWSIYEDREGNVWVGTHEGLHRLTAHVLTPLTSVGLARAVTPHPDGGVWIGTASGLLRVAREPDGTVRTETVLTGHDVRALADDGGGTLWLATPAGVFAWRDGRLTGQARPDDDDPLDVLSLAAEHGDVWVADAERGILRAEGGRLTPASGHGDLPAAAVSAAVVDASGRVWLASAGGVLRRLGDAGMEESVDIGAPVRGLAAAAGGGVWVGADDGLSLVRDGRRLRMRGTELPGRAVTALATDADGALWLAVERALLRITPEEFERAATEPDYRPDYRLFTTAHGVAGVPITVAVNNGAARDRAGTLWFVTGRGVTVIDPAAVAATPDPPEGRVHVEAVTADERRLPGASRLSVGAGVSRLQIDYSTLQLSRASTTRFRYRLVGFDTDWIQAGTQRQAVYTNLSPGVYRFLVQAESEEQGWASIPTEFDLTLEPAFHQTFAFYALLALALAGLGWLGWEARLRIVRQQFSLALAERVRLSREMHDTLLQSLVGFALQIDGIAHASDGGGDTRARLVRMRRQVEGYIRDVRQSIWDLRSDTFEEHDLAPALRAACARLAQPGTRVDLRVRGHARPCDPQVERHLLRIGQEAVTNAVRHAAARVVVVDLEFTDDGIALRVRDDGAGFDPGTQVGRAGHYGLNTMRERAADMGAACRIDSTPGAGTTVEVHVPIAAAAGAA